MSGIITPGQSKLVLHNRSEPYELTYNIAKRWENNKSRIVLISESGSNEQTSANLPNFTLSERNSKTKVDLEDIYSGAIVIATIKSAINRFREKN